MSEILQKENRQKAGVSKTKKAGLRVDLTPMVDLGFLLIAFFIFTTSISQPTIMKLAMPDDTDNKNPSEAADSKTLNLILGADNKVYTYNGLDSNNIKNIGSSTTAIRSAILEKKNEIKNIYGSDSGIIVLIKPTPVSNYANIVNTLDEMLICNIKTYVLEDATINEFNKLK